MGMDTLCNYCKLEGIRRDAKKNKKRVVMVSAGFNEGLGGQNIHLLIRKGEKPTEENRVSWMREITAHCVC